MADMEVRVCKYRKFIVRCIRGPELISYLIPRIKELQDEVGNRRKRRLNTDDCWAQVSPVDELIDIIIRSTEPGKWKTFIDGLQQSDYPYLAEILEAKSVAVDNVDYEQNIIQLFSPDLEKHIIPQEIMSELYSKDIISTADKENILARERTHGTTAATVVLLDRMQCRTHPKFWYPAFLGILMEKGYGQLVNDVDPDFADCAGQCQLLEAATEAERREEADYSMLPKYAEVGTENNTDNTVRGFMLTKAHAKSSTKVSQLADIEASISPMEPHANQLKLSREQSVANIKSMEQSCQAAVRKVKNEIVDWAERMEKKTLAEIHTAVNKWVDVISEQVGACDTSNVSISFTPDQKLADLRKTYTQLGTVDVTATADPSVSPQLPGGSGCIGKYIRDMTVASSTVVNVPSDYITGSVFMPDGRLVLVSRNNNLLLLDRVLNMKSKLQLPGKQTWDVAVAGNTEVIVTMPGEKKLLFVDVATTPRTGRTVDVNRKCYGVAIVGGDIYVSVHDKPGDGAVLVMDGIGQVRRRIGVDDHGRGIFQRPFYIAVSSKGTVYVSDGDGGISCYSGTGHKLYHVHHKDMKKPRGIQMDRDGNLLVCCRNSDDVHVLKHDGALDRVFLTSRDGLTWPYSLTYRNTDDTLIVTMRDSNPSVRAYKLQ